MCTEIPDIFINKQWLINDLRKIVDDGLAGFVRCNPLLALLDNGRVVIIRDHLNVDKVKIISGGASGHEPSFVGFVGQGMLTASVQGGIYSSPPPKLVLNTIKELARRHDKGILVIIGDNMGDRLNFSLAVERAKNIPNVKIRLLIVSDDCNKTFERRGMAGTLLIQKIAGAMAELDYFLYDIHIFCTNLLNNLSTVLISLKPAVSPYLEISSCARTITKDIEFESGMHGQPGYFTKPLLSSHETVQLMLNHLTSDETMEGKINIQPDVPVVLLINNLGLSSKLEEFIFINEVTTQLQNENIIIARIYSGSYLTSLEMCGFSLTILNVTQPEILTYLDWETNAPFWKTFTRVVLTPEESLSISSDVPAAETQLKPNRGPVVSEKTSKIIQQAINFACGAIISCEKQLNLMDSESGDSDTGTNIRRIAFKINDYLTKGKLKLQWPFMLFKEISKILETTLEGFLACFYAIMFEAAAQPLLALTEHDFITIGIWAQVYDSVCISIESCGRVPVGQGTMFTALQAANEVFQNVISPSMCSLDVIGLATVAAEDAAKRTRPEQALYPDPGAHAVGIWMRAIYETLKLHEYDLK